MLMEQYHERLPIYERIAAINQAELYPAPMMPFFRILKKLGFETLGDVNRLIEDDSDNAYQLAVSQLGTTDLDILSENVGLQYLCFVYVLKQGGGLTELCQIFEWLKGPDSGNMLLAKELLKQAQSLTFMK